MTRELRVEREFFHQVHGAAFDNDDGSSRQVAIRRCRPGDEVFLVPDPDDLDALRVCTRDGRQIGYWADDAGRMAEDVRRGHLYRVFIEEIYPFSSDAGLLGAQLRIEVLEGPATSSP